LSWKPKGFLDVSFSRFHETSGSENMDTEIYSFALKTTLNEIQNICPDIRNSFIYKEDGEIIARNDPTNEQTIVQFIDLLDAILERTETIGDTEFAAFNFSKGRLNVSHIDDLYFVTVASNNVDQSYMKTINDVLVPTILKLIEKITTSPINDNFKINNQQVADEIEPEREQIPEAGEEQVEPIEEFPFKKLRETIKTKEENSDISPETTANQFIVENIGGLLVPSDTVRVDSETLLQWEKTYDDNSIQQVEIETFGGKTTQCKVKPLKDSKYVGKGIVQMPEKIRSTLEIKKGELVRVKPIIP
jgi:hypothetical protein